MWKHQIACVLLSLFVVGCGDEQPKWLEGQWQQQGHAERSPSLGRDDCSRQLICTPGEFKSVSSHDAFILRIRIDRGVERNTHVRPMEPFVHSGYVLGANECVLPQKKIEVKCEFCVDRIDCTDEALTLAVRKQHCCIP
jgi:hypothetical protein